MARPCFWLILDGGLMMFTRPFLPPGIRAQRRASTYQSPVFASLM